MAAIATTTASADVTPAARVDDDDDVQAAKPKLPRKAKDLIFGGAKDTSRVTLPNTTSKNPKTHLLQCPATIQRAAAKLGLSSKQMERAIETETLRVEHKKVARAHRKTVLQGAGPGGDGLKEKELLFGGAYAKGRTLSHERSSSDGGGVAKTTITKSRDDDDDGDDVHHATVPVEASPKSPKDNTEFPKLLKHLALSERALQQAGADMQRRADHRKDVEATHASTGRRMSRKATDVLIGGHKAAVQPRVRKKQLKTKTKTKAEETKAEAPNTSTPPPRQTRRRRTQTKGVRRAKMKEPTTLPRMQRYKSSEMAASRGTGRRRRRRIIRRNAPAIASKNVSHTLPKRHASHTVLAGKTIAMTVPNKRTSPRGQAAAGFSEGSFTKLNARLGLSGRELAAAQSGEALRKEHKQVASRYVEQQKLLMRADIRSLLRGGIRKRETELKAILAQLHMNVDDFRRFRQLQRTQFDPLRDDTSPQAPTTRSSATKVNDILFGGKTGPAQMNRLGLSKRELSQAKREESLRREHRRATLENTKTTQGASKAKARAMLVGDVRGKGKGPRKRLGITASRLAKAEQEESLRREHRRGARTLHRDAAAKRRKPMDLLHGGRKRTAGKNGKALQKMGLSAKEFDTFRRFRKAYAKLGTFDPTQVPRHSAVKTASQEAEQLPTGEGRTNSETTISAEDVSVHGELYSLITSITKVRSGKTTADVSRVESKVEARGTPATKTNSILLPLSSMNEETVDLDTLLSSEFGSAVFTQHMIMEMREVDMLAYIDMKMFGAHQEGVHDEQENSPTVAARRQRRLTAGARRIVQEYLSPTVLERIDLPNEVVTAIRSAIDRKIVTPGLFKGAQEAMRKNFVDDGVLQRFYAGPLYASYVAQLTESQEAKGKGSVG